MKIGRAERFLLETLKSPPPIQDGRTDEGRAGIFPSTTRDWESILAAARRQGLSSLLFSRLPNVLGVDKIPPSVRDQFRSDSLRNAARNMRFYHGLGRILARCDAAGIPVIVLKGAHLAEAVYGNIAHRAFGDVDLLAQESDLRQIDHLLKRERFIRTEAGLEATPDAHHFHYLQKKLGLTIELHWQLCDTRSIETIDTNGLFLRAQKLRLAGQPALVLEPVDLVLYLCVHAGIHFYDNRLRGLFDIDRVMMTRPSPPDWAALAERARDWRAAKGVFLTLRLCQFFFGTEIPDETMKRLEPEDFEEKYLAAAVDKILSPRGGEGIMPTRGLTLFWGERRFGRKLMFLLKTLFPAPGQIAQGYPVSPKSILVAAYYPIYFLRLLRNKRASLGRLARSVVTRAPQKGPEDRTATLWNWLRSG